MFIMIYKNNPFRLFFQIIVLFLLRYDSAMSYVTILLFRFWKVYYFFFYLFFFILKCVITLNFICSIAACMFTIIVIKFPEKVKIEAIFLNKLIKININSEQFSCRVWKLWRNLFLLSCKPLKSFCTYQKL